MDQTVLEGVAVVAVVTLEVPVAAGRILVGVVVDHSTVVRSNPTRLALIVVLDTLSLSFLTSDNLAEAFVFFYYSIFCKRTQ